MQSAPGHGAEPAQCEGLGLTTDPRDPAVVEAQAAEMHACLAGGGVGIVPLDVAYAILGAREGAIRRLFAAKERSYDKPSGLFGNLEISAELHVLAPDRRTAAQALLQAGLPFSIVAPFRADSPLLAGVDAFVLQSSTKAGTLDMLINAGAFHNALAQISLARGLPVFGSSANRSLTGSRYRVADIHPEVLQAADLVIDHGASAYANEEGLSSTILDFRDFTVVRRGVRFDAIGAVLRDQFGVTLAPPG